MRVGVYLHEQVYLCLHTVHGGDFGFTLLEKVFLLLDEFLLPQVQT